MIRFWTAIALCGLLAGCGSGGGSSDNGIVVIPPFNPSRVGTWTGTETDSVGHTSGPMTLTIDAAGNISGSWQPPGASWAIAGTDSNTAAVDNFASLGFDAPGSPHLTGNCALVVQGDGKMTGGLALTRPNPPNAVGITTLAFSLILTRQ